MSEYDDDGPDRRARLFLVLSSRGPYGFSLFNVTADEAEARRETRAIKGALVAVDVDVLLDVRPAKERPQPLGPPTSGSGGAEQERRLAAGS
jgi:hypothetical protein